MRSKKVTFRVPWVVHDLMHEEALSRGYRTLARYFLAVGLLDVYEARRRRWMRDIANANPKTQDFMIDEFARLPIEHHEIERIFKLIAEARKLKNRS
jgi:hypothetical protein